MKDTHQTTVTIDKAALKEKTRQLCGEQYRLAQIGCTKLPDNSLELNYSFDKDYRILNVRIPLKNHNEPIPSISDIYWCAFIYENELHDLFGVSITDIAVDYKGNFYKTALKHPFLQQRPAPKQGA